MRSGRCKSGVIFGALRWVRQNIKSICQLNELIFVTGVGVVWVKTRGEKAKDTVNRLRLSIGADLEELIVIRKIHSLAPLKSRSGIPRSKRLLCLCL